MSATKTVPLLQQYLKFVQNGRGFERFAKQINVISAKDGNVRAELKIGQEHANFYHGLHGSCSASLVQIASDLALLDQVKTIDYSAGNVDILFLKAAKKDDTLVIEAKTVKREPNLRFLEILIKNKDSGDLLVKATNTKYVE